MADASEPAVLVSVTGQVGRIVLNRPQKHNAFDDDVIATLAAHLSEFDRREDIRVVVLAAVGDSFSAGADLGWFKRAAGYGLAENIADARRLADMLATLNALSKPTVALVQGSAYGGGLGLIAACDVAIASATARFSFSETRLGLIPAMISPYVLAAIGRRAARRYFLTAEPFDAAEALRIGLVHDVVPAADLAAAGDRIIAALKAAGPRAVAEAKRLIADVAEAALDRSTIAETARRIATLRESAEGREGVAAFLERRKPAWRSD
jgi:methylglutaconyl-CoA hydratase